MTMPSRDPNSVYRVIQMVAGHSESWEEAAAVAVAEATKTIADLRVAQVVEFDTLVRESKVVAYRVRLKVSYRMDRRRSSEQGGEVEVRRYLVVANQTVGGAALTEAIRQRIAAGPSEFHVLVPATLSKDFAAARRLATFSVDPTSGYAFGDLGALPRTDEEGLSQARARLDMQLLQIVEAGATPTGEVGEPDPLVAIASVLERASFDEILLSTLPASVSRWLRMDLPSRLERRFAVPLTAVVDTEVAP